VKTKEVLIKELYEINKKIEGGQVDNPAWENEGGVCINGITGLEVKEIIELIGNWSYKKEEKRMENLYLCKDSLEDELGKLL